MLTRKIPGRALLGAIVALSALPVDEAGGVWNVLAYEADLTASGVKLTKKDFEDCVKNFARYPKVPIVVEHADTDLFGKAEWAEAHGWITEVRVGIFTRPDGSVVASLEGRLLPDSATRLAINGTKDAAGNVVDPPKWPFGSVTVFRGHDEETDTDVGMCLWSFSLTTHPRLVDVPRLAAGMRPQIVGAFARGQVEAGYYWGSIDDREDLVEALRSIFELPALAAEADVIAALDRFEKLVTGVESADGVDTDCLLRNLREAMRLPALSTATEVIAEVRRGLSTLPTEPTDSPATMSQRNAQEQTTMKYLELAAKLGISAANEDDAREKILALAQQGHELHVALGAKTHGEAVASLSKLSADAVKVPGLEKELNAFRTERDERVAKQRETHVESVIAAMCLPEGQSEKVKASLALHAKTDWEGFQKEYPLPSAETLAQRAQDGARTARVAKPGRKSAASADVGAGPSTDELVEAATQLVEDHADRGIVISFSEALGMLTDPASATTTDDEPAE